PQHRGEAQPAPGAPAHGALRRGRGDRARGAVPRLRRVFLHHRQRVHGRRRPHRRLRHAGMKQRTVSPVDGSVYVERELASDAVLEKTLRLGVEAQKSWKKIPVAERVEICRRMVAWCVTRADELGSELAWQMGRPIAYGPNELKRGFQERAQYMCGIAEEALGDINISPGRFIRREPLGVVLVVAPWNYPWLTSVNAVVPA